MLRKSDVRWWVLEARKHPEAAPEIIEQLASRIKELDKENERLRDEMIALSHRREATTVASDQLDHLRERVSTLQRLLDERTSLDPTLLLFSAPAPDGGPPVARISLPSVGRAVREQRRLPRTVTAYLTAGLIALPQHEILAVERNGRCSRLLPVDVQPLQADLGWPARAADDGTEGDRKGRHLFTATATLHQPPRFWSAVTRRGHVRQVLQAEIDRHMDDGHPLAPPGRRDPVVALAPGDEGDLLILSRWGQAARFPQRAIGSQWTPAIELDEDDCIVDALSLPAAPSASQEIALMTGSGLALRFSIARIAQRATPGGQGRHLMRAFDVMAVAHATPGTRLLILTYSGRLLAPAIGDAPLVAQAAKGEPLGALEGDPAQLAVPILPAHLRSLRRAR